MNNQFSIKWDIVLCHFSVCEFIFSISQQITLEMAQKIDECAFQLPCLTQLISLQTLMDKRSSDQQHACQVDDKGKLRVDCGD